MTLADRVAREVRALSQRAWAVRLLTALGVAVLCLALFAVLHGDGRWRALPRVMPLLAWACTAVVAALVVRAVARRVPAPHDVSQLAHGIERERGLRTGALRGALEIGGQGALGARALRDVESRLTGNEVLMPARRRELTRGVLAAAGLAVSATLVLVASHFVARDGFAAVVHPVKAWRGLLLPPLAFDNVPGEVPRGMPLTVRVQAPGRAQVTLRVRAAGDAWRDETLTVSEVDGSASWDAGPMRAPLQLELTDGRAPLVATTVGVGDRGWVGDVAIDAIYPAYLGRTRETLDARSPLRVPRGTELLVRAIPHAGAVNVRLVVKADTVALRTTADATRTSNASTAPGVPTAADGDAPLFATLDAQSDRVWQWIADASPNADGVVLPVEVPNPLVIGVIPDAVPEVVIVSPAADGVIGNTGRVAFQLDAIDDHGLAAVALRVRRELADGSAGTDERVPLASPSEPVWSGSGSIMLDGRGLEAGDRLILVAEATDASPWRQVGTSRPVVLRVPTAEEQRVMARSLADSLVRRADQLASAEQELQRATRDASRARELQSNARESGAASGSEARAEGAPKNSMSYQAAEKTRSLAQQQRNLDERVNELRAGADELQSRLEQAGAMDDALAARFNELQRMLQEALTPEMQQQLEQLERASDQLSSTEARQSLEQLAAQQQRMREQLEKSAEMLRRAALEGAMETLRDEARELADAERELADALSRPQDAAKQATPDARTLAERTRRLERDVASLSERLSKEGADAGARRTEAAQPDLAAAREAMDRAAEQSAQQAAEQRGQQAGQQPGQQTPPQRGQQAGQQPGQQAAAPRGQQAGQQGGKQDEQKANAAPPGDAKGSNKQSARDSSGRESGARDGNPADSAGGRDGGMIARMMAGMGGQQPGKGTSGQKENEATGGTGGTPDRDGSGRTGGQQEQQGAGAQSRDGQGSAAGNAARAADAMENAAGQLAAAREAQVDAWKQDLAQQLDQTINETAQLARQQAQLEQRAKQRGVEQGMAGEQGAVQQGVQQAAARLEEAARGSALLSQQSQRAMGEAMQRVQQATQAMGGAGQPGGSEAAQQAMQDASQSLNQALASLVRDRERVNAAGSASGFGDLLEQMKELAEQQGAVNGQMQGLSMLPGGGQGQAAQQQARALARQQREIARGLQDAADADPTGRTDALAREAQQVAQSLERGGVDAAIAGRQQQLYRRLLDAGRFLEQNERDDQGPREARAGDGRGTVGARAGATSGRAGARYAAPTWSELRSLSAEERRLVLEYFRRLNAGTP